jgi:DnaJ family protein A protein 2
MSYYDILEVSKGASQTEIKQAYRKKAMTSHPDKGGDAEIFKNINLAYETLSDPEKRKQYDNKDNFNFANNINHMFNMNSMFNIFNPFKTKISPEIVIIYSATLEDLCKRKIEKLKVQRNIQCECLKNSEIKVCPECNGTGMITINSYLTPFMFTQTQQTCQKCKGMKKTRVYNENCKECNKGEKQDEIELELFLSPEFENGYKYTFHKKGNHLQEHEPGNIVVIIKYTDHTMFKVENKNLLITVPITLKSALCGSELEIPHPSGETIKLSTDIVSPDTVETIKGKGLTEDGDLIIRFNIQFPTSLSKEQVEILYKNL